MTLEMIIWSKDDLITVSVKSNLFNNLALTDKSTVSKLSYHL